MSAELATVNDVSAEVITSLVTRGDLSMLTAQQRAEYYLQLCERVGLDPATKPFDFIKLNGKEVAYANKGAGDQLRRKHKISVVIVAREKLDDVYYVTARATMPDGRCDESQGAVSIAGLKGDFLANAVMKAETKSKRRVTLSIVGLAMLDESELETETIPQRSIDRLPPERELVAQANVVVMAPPAKLEAARAAAAQPRPEPADGLPKVWTPLQPIPASMLPVIPGISELTMPVAEMTTEQLEQVVEAVAHTYERWKEDPRRTEKQLNLLNKIGASASAVHYSKTNNGGEA